MPVVVAFVWAIWMDMIYIFLIREFFGTLALWINIASNVSKINVSRIVASLLIRTPWGFAGSPQQLSLIAFTTPRRPVARNVTTATSSWAIPASRFPTTIVYLQKLELLSVWSAEMVFK